jgi:hypothetical protein
MGIKMSKDKQMIRDAVERFTHELEVIHQKYMLGVGQDRELYHRRIDYAQGLKVFYEQLEKELMCKKELIRDVPLTIALIKEPYGLKLVITKGFVRVKEYINYSPYYISGNNIDTTPIKEQMQLPGFLKRYAQYC